ncbi:MAG: DegV family protein [Gemmatimonadota bacterium]
MPIRYLDGPRLCRAVIAGAHAVRRVQEMLDRINVFPVSDSDTGTNMAATLAGAAAAAREARVEDVGAMSRRIAESALLDARGNSGVILAQFFQGLAEGLDGCTRVTASRFAAAARRASDAARSALARPQEGTMLTVMSDWAGQLEAAAVRSEDFVAALRESLGTARGSLARTPQMLRVLARAGVVDAGAQGFVSLLEGIQAFIETRRADLRPEPDPAPPAAAEARVDGDAPILFQFCTECLLEGEALDRERLREELGGMGDSLVLAGSPRRLRVHVHTNDPEAVFTTVARQGRIVGRKTDDMRAQHQLAHGGGSAGEPEGAAGQRRIAIVSDSACDLPDELLRRHRIHLIPLGVQFGAESFLDRRTLSVTEFYAKLAASPYHPTTSQPAPANFLSVYRHLVRNYESVVSIHISGALSGTLGGAERAAREVDAGRIHVIDSRTASAAQGLVVLAVAEAVEDGRSLAEVVDRARRAAETARLFVSVPSTEFLVRGGRVGRTKGLLARALDLQPILTIGQDGKPAAAARARGARARHARTLELALSAAEPLANPRFAVAHADALEQALGYEPELRRTHPRAEVLMAEVGPALGAHGGPGATAIAVCESFERAAAAAPRALAG